MPSYSRAQIENLLCGARALGFQDEVEHWTAMLAQLDAN